MPLPSALLSALLPAAFLPFAAAQSEVTGDLSSTPGPYGIPSDAFESATSHPSANVSFPIPGYNISAPSGSDSTGNGSSIAGWQLSVAVAPDVSLQDANGGNVDKSRVTEATTLSIHTPDGGAGMDFDRSWKVCAVVYRGLAGSETSSAQDTSKLDGTCEQLLPSDCIKQLVVDASSQGISADGSCETAGIPSKCQGHFMDGANGTAFAITQSVLSSTRFYAFGSAPVSSGNNTALGVAEGNVWPVILTWAHLSSDGKIQAANANVACVKAGNGTGTGTGGGGSGGGTGTGSPTPTPSAGKNVRAFDSRWALVLVLGVAVLLF